MGSSKREAEVDREVLREYYLENNFLTSTEGILKVISAVVCTGLSLLALAGGGCARGAGSLSLAAALLLAALCAAAALGPASYAPDITVSTVVGGALLVTGILSITLCGLYRVLDYIHGPVAIFNAALVMGSVVITYMSVVKRWDAARRALPVEPAAPIRVELEV